MITFIVPTRASNIGDVDILDISWLPKEPEVGDNLRINILLQNKSDADIKNLILECYINGELVYTFPINQISKKSNYEHTFNWKVDKYNFKITAILNLGNEHISKSKLYFSGYSWNIKKSIDIRKGPSFNYWSDSDDNVWVDDQGLHLKITEKNDKWYCSEIYSDESFGYGKYTFYLDGRPDLFDKNVVFGLFTYYENPDITDKYIEIDIEFSKWGSSLPNIFSRNSQYVVHPVKKGTIHRFKTILNGDYSTHYFDWEKDLINFKSIHGHNEDNNDIRYIISSKKFYGDKIPVPNKKEKVHINLWLYDSNGDKIGDTPSDGKETEIVITKFKFK